MKLHHHHIGIEVENLVRAKSFYIEVLGFNEEYCLRLPEEKVVFLTKEGFRIELIEPLGEFKESDGYHLAFTINDFGFLENELQNFGLKHVEGPYNLDNGWKVIFFEDEKMQLYEWIEM